MLPKNNIKLIFTAVFIIVFIFLLINYKQIPVYHNYLIANSLNAECKNTETENKEKSLIPCNSYFDCRREKLSDYCGSSGYTLGTRCDYECSVKTFCLDGYCRTNSYMGTWVAW